MAKYRHRIFEMYEFRDEAVLALTPKTEPKTEKLAEEVTASESRTFRHFTVSHAAGVTHVVFTQPQICSEESASELREDFTQLADGLVRDSKVLLDFTGVVSFSSASIDVLALFNRKLKTKGSRIALCCLAPAVHQSFFETPGGHEQGN